MNTYPLIKRTLKKFVEGFFLCKFIVTDVTYKTQYVVCNSVIFQKNNHMLCLSIYIQGDALYNKDDENYFLPLFITFFFFHLEYLTVPWFVTHTTRGAEQVE